MAVISNELLSFSTVGQREDISDLIFNISPWVTPFMSRIGKNRATATYHEWQSDTLRTAAANNQLEGDEFTPASLAATTRLGNSTSISSIGIQVSDTASAITTAGRKFELSFQVVKGARILKRDMEVTLTGNQAPVRAGSTQSPGGGGSNSTTARQLRPLTGWYATNTANVGAGGANGSASAARSDGTQAAMTEATLKTLLQSIYTSGGEPNVVMATPFNRVLLSTFAGPTGTQRWNQADKDTLSTSISLYRRDFGDLEILVNRFSRARDVHVLEEDLWMLSTLRPFSVVDLSKSGDSERALIRVEYTLESRNEAGSGLLADATTS